MSDIELTAIETSLGRVYKKEGKMFDCRVHTYAAVGGWLLIIVMSAPVQPIWLPLARGAVGIGNANVVFHQ